MHHYAQALLDNDRYLLVSHERPDGDAWGSLLAMHQWLLAAGKDVVSLISEKDLDSFPSVQEVLPVRDLSVQELPEDWRLRKLICLDLANIERIGFEFPDVPEVWMQFDHHPDTLDYASDYNLVNPDSPSTTQILWRIFRDADGPLEDTPVLDVAVGEALAVGLLTDTLFFSISKTNAESFEMARHLTELGVAVPKLGVGLQKELAAETFVAQSGLLAKTEFSHDDQIATLVISQEDLGPYQPVKLHTHNLLRALRTVSGVKALVVMVEDADAPGGYKGSLRSDDPEIVINDIAKRYGGGGHAQAAGFYVSGRDPLEAAEEIRDAVARKLLEPALV